MAASPWLPHPVEKAGSAGGRWQPRIFVALALVTCAAGLVAYAVWRFVVGGDATSTAERPPSQASGDTAPDNAPLPVVPDKPNLVTVSTPRAAAKSAADHETFDPRHDGWSSEAFVERADGLWSLVRQRLTRQDGSQSIPLAGEIGQRIAADFSGTVLRPGKLREIVADGPLVVRRFDASAAELPAGAGGFLEAVDQLAARFAGSADAHAHVKTIGVESQGDTATTTILIEIAGHTAEKIVQSKLTCQCHWSAAESQSPRLQSLTLVDYEEADRSARWFTDCTAAALGQNASYREQLLHGLNHWLGRVERAHGIDVYGRHGMAIGDVNGDDREDFYLCQPGGLPNRLYVQNEDGTFTDTSAAAGVDWLDRTASALFVDLDNDDDQDLVVATYAGLLAMRNDGSGRFTLETTLAPLDFDVQSLSAVDYDNDGDLDLYICTEFANLARYKDEPAPRFVYHDANDGGANVLFRNDAAAPAGPWKFTDVTVAVGLDEDNRRHSLAAAWEDFDNDGDQDLYVANDYGQNCLYRNDKGKFQNVAKAAGVTDFGSGMSVAWGDANRDGWPDLYVGNMFSSAGNRVTGQAAFLAGADESTRAVYRQFARGNSFFLGGPEGTFHNASHAAGVEIGRWAWSSLFADLNNDGRDEIVVANGYITGDDADDL